MKLIDGIWKTTSLYYFSDIPMVNQFQLFLGNGLSLSLNQVKSGLNLLIRQSINNILIQHERCDSQWRVQKLMNCH